MVNLEQNYIIRILKDDYDSKELRGIKKEDIPWAAEMFLAALLVIVLYTVEKDGFWYVEKLGKTIGLSVLNLFNYACFINRPKTTI